MRSIFVPTFFSVYGTVVENTLLRHFFLLHSGIPSEIVARDCSFHWLNIIARAVAATFAGDIGSDFSLPKLRKN